jgi:hypothetical protein
MRQSRPLLPIRSLELPARLGRRQRSLTSASFFGDVCVRLERNNLAAARAARPVWLRGPLFQSRRSQPVTALARHVA